MPARIRNDFLIKTFSIGSVGMDSFSRTLVGRSYQGPPIFYNPKLGSDLHARNNATSGTR